MYSRLCDGNASTKQELLEKAQFIELNDAKVRPISLENALACTNGAKSAYVLAYVPLREYI